MSYDYGPMMADVSERQMEAEQLTAFSVVKLRTDLVKLRAELTSCKETLARQEESFSQYKRDIAAAMEKQEHSNKNWNIISNSIALAALIVAIISFVAK